jgi:hypothetical protein
MNDPMNFTDRERVVVHYYRDAREPLRTRAWFQESAYLLPSLGCVALYLWRDDIALGFVGYALLLCRACYSLVAGVRCAEDLRAALQKYDVKVRELSEALEKKST